MERIGILIFLVVLVPGGIYWASHDFESPSRNISRFATEVSALSGGTPPPEETPAPGEEPESEPEKKPTEEPEPKPKEPEPVEVPDVPLNPREEAQKLYDAGKFAEAATAFVGVDDKMQNLSQLGAAFAAAFPENVPSARYVVIRTTTGGEFEGFAEDSGNLLKLTSAGGRSLTFPQNTVSTQREIPRAEAMDRLAKRIGTEGLSVRTKGPRLFALIHEAFAIGRPAAAGPLLPRAVELDEEKEFFLSSVKNRVKTAYQPALFNAFAACMIPPEAAPETVVQAPRKLGGNGSRPRTTRQKSSIKNADAKRLVEKARPLRAKGVKLYRKVFAAGLDGAQVQDIDDAVEALEAAIDLYQKAMEHEDSGEINAMITGCSKMTFKLRFWREQVEGR